jgi:hypothetical protein
MNKRTTLVVSLAAALTFSGALYGVASATETPHPLPLPTCGQAVTNVLEFKGVTDAQAKLDTLNGELKSFTDGLAALQKSVADNIALDNTNKATVDSPATVTAKNLLKARQDLIADVNAQIVVANKAMVDAKAKLSVLVKIRDKVCAPKTGPTGAPGTPGDPGAPGTPGAPGASGGTTLVPVPVPGAPAPVVTNPQITVVPNTSAGVNTGDGSLA